MTLTDQNRLAMIRAESEKWQALQFDAKNWDTAFLLTVIDRLIEEKNL